jgi:CubicO group peptidase (beta-lactamase class C family)
VRPRLDIPGGPPAFVFGRIEGGHLVESRSGGSEYRDGSVPIAADAPFEAASLSKPVITRWVLELAAAGAIDLEAPIDLDPAAVGAEPDPRLAAITPAMVLSHCTGLPNWRADGQPLRLVAGPGEKITYSGEAFEYLLAALRRQLGERQVEADLAALLDRLGMVESSFADEDGRPHRPSVDGHSVAGQVIRPQPRPVARAAGSLHTTVLDYARFLRASLWPADDDRIGQAACRAMAELRVGVDEDGRTMGWASTNTAAGPLLWQNGDNPGFKHLVAVRPDSGEGVVLLTNGDTGLLLVREVATAMGIPPRHRDGYRGRGLDRRAVGERDR